MAKGKLFEYAVIHHPRPAKKDDPEPKSVLLVEPKRVLVASDQECAIHASREIPEAFLDKLDEVEIVVRPF